jgi:hypothetical protein
MPQSQFTAVDPTWIVAGTTKPNTFTGGNKFVSPSTTSSGILVQSSGTISAEEAPTTTNVSARFQGAETASPAHTVQINSCGFHNVLSFNRANGTYASKTGLVTSNSVFQIFASGWDNVATYRTGGAITTTATENWSATNCGMRMNFLTCADGTTSARSVLILRQDGTTEPQFGIRFGSTGLSVLSTYEEGTWTPVVSSTGATFSVNATETVGRYVRIGKMVFVEFAVQLSGATTGTTTNQVNIAGMPYASQLIGTGHNHRPVLIGESFTTTATGGLVANLVASTAFNVAVASTTGGTSALTAGTFSGSGARITGAFSYQVA